MLWSEGRDWDGMTSGPTGCGMTEQELSDSGEESQDIEGGRGGKGDYGKLGRGRETV